MQALPKALFIVMLELTAGSFLSLYLLDLRRDTSRGFVIFQGVLYLLFAGLTLLAMNAFATPELVRGYGLDADWLRAQEPLVLAFAVLMIPWNILLGRDRSPRSIKKAANTAVRAPATRKQVARFSIGAAASLAGLAALFDVGMAYRPLAESRLGGAFVVLAFLAGGIAIGGVMTAMLLGHWYLNTPTASGKPLEFTTVLLLGALAAELCFTLLIGPSTAHPAPGATVINPGTTIQVSGGQLMVTTPTPLPDQQAAQVTQAEQSRVAPLGANAMVWLQFLMGFLAPLILGGITLYLTRGRSFQSATGMLYLCVAFIFIGEVIGRGLLLTPIF